MSGAKPPPCSGPLSLNNEWFPLDTRDGTKGPNGGSTAVARCMREGEGVMTDTMEATYPNEELPRPLVLVGVDGSTNGLKAVTWAVDYATRTGGSVELLIAWQWPMTYGYPVALPDFNPEAEAIKLLEKAAADISLPAERVRTVVVPGTPSQALVARSDDVDLLVVGSRGLGGFSGLMLGSVSTYCVHHAHCPVVVVRPDTD